MLFCAIQGTRRAIRLGLTWNGYEISLSFMYTNEDLSWKFHAESSKAGAVVSAGTNFENPQAFTEQLVEVFGVAEDHVAALVEVEPLWCHIRSRRAACDTQLSRFFHKVKC